MKRYVAALCAIIFFLAGLAAVVPAQGAITIVKTEASFTFQKEARFSLEANGESDISKAILFFRLADQTAVNATEKTIAPARSVSVNHTWSLAGSDLPSGAVVTYWWAVEDAAGNKVESDRCSFVYEDTRYSWKKLSREDITLAWYSGNDSMGRELLDAAVSASQRLATEFGVERKPATIYIYGSYEDLRSGIGDSAQEWTGGRAYPEYGVVMIGVPSSQLSFGKRAVPHEVAHLMVHRATSNPYGDIPRWLDEGLAMWSEGSLESVYDNALKRAIKANALLSLKTLSSNFPADADQASLAYAESYSVVNFMRTSFGREKIGALLQAFRQGNTGDGALQAVLGVTTSELDGRWRTSVGIAAAAPAPSGQPAQTSAPASTPGFLAPNIALVIVGGLLAGAAVVLLALVLVIVAIVKS